MLCADKYCATVLVWGIYDLDQALLASQSGKTAVLFDERFRRAVLDDLAIGHEQDPVDVHDGGDAVGDDQDST